MDVFYKVTKVPNHELIKPLILDSIDRFEYRSAALPDEQVSKTDWGVPQDTFRPYIHYLMPFLYTELAETYRSMGGDGIEITNFWFQQYRENDRYDWHNHIKSNLANIYYLEFPEGSPKTEFLNPSNPNEIITFDVKEGEVLTVPAYLIHRSPPVTKSNIRKTIIAINAELFKRGGVYANFEPGQPQQ